MVAIVALFSMAGLCTVTALAELFIRGNPRPGCMMLALALINGASAVDRLRWLKWERGEQDRIKKRRERRLAIMEDMESMIASKCSEETNGAKGEKR